MKSIRKTGLPILRRQLLDATRKLLDFQSAADLIVSFGLGGIIIPSNGDALHQEDVALQNRKATTMVLPAEYLQPVGTLYFL